MINVEKGKVELKGERTEIGAELIMLALSIKKHDPEMLEEVMGFLQENKKEGTNLYNEYMVQLIKNKISENLNAEIGKEKMVDCIGLLKKVTREFNERLKDVAGIYHIQDEKIIVLTTIIMMQALNEYMEIVIEEG